jgi:carbon monoxide dehydrogenase subunit G
VLKCVVKPGFAFMRATLKMTLEIVEATPDSLVQYRIASSGIGASMKVACTMRIAPEGEGSRVEWVAQVTELSGLIAAVSPALIRGAAEKVIREAWGAVRGQVEG